MRKIRPLTLADGFKPGSLRRQVQTANAGNRLTWVSLFMVLRRTERFDLTFQLRKDRLHIRRDRLASGNQTVHHIKESFTFLFSSACK